TVNANVEKTIFLGPSPLALDNDVRPGLSDLRLPTLAPAANPVLERRIAVQFPSATAPRGRESWYLLHGLESGRRYEVRICWPATQPTDFWLDTFPISHVFDAPDLIASLAAYSEQRQQSVQEEGELLSEQQPPISPSTLFLRIQAAASFYSSNKTLMEHPPLVDADITTVLDPYLWNILPRSLAPTVAYICAVAPLVWLLSGFIYRFLLSVAADSTLKAHDD
ncbi:hypothetical protein EJ04DRAFT_399168, partial [Polyplosphaeria fusca]